MNFCRILAALILVTTALLTYQGIKIARDEVLSTTIKHYLNDLTTHHGDINLMLGSSSIAGLSAEKYLGCGKWLNRGIGNSTITDLINYLSFSKPEINPLHTLIYAGENDLSRGISVNTTIANYQQLIELLRSNYSNSRLYLMAIKPSPRRSQHWSLFEQINSKLQQIAEQHEKVYYVSLLWQNSTEEFSKDGIHLTEKGYKIFTAGVNEICQPQ